MITSSCTSIYEKIRERNNTVTAEQCSYFLSNSWACIHSGTELSSQDYVCKCSPHAPLSPITVIAIIPVQIIPIISSCGFGSTISCSAIIPASYTHFHFRPLHTLTTMPSQAALLIGDITHARPEWEQFSSFLTLKVSQIYSQNVREAKLISMCRNSPEERAKNSCKTASLASTTTWSPSTAAIRPTSTRARLTASWSRRCPRDRKSVV